MNLPGNALYATSSRLGGYGLDLQAFEAVRGIYRAGILGRALCYHNRQREIPAQRVRSLRWHPVRLLSFLETKYYYGAKKHYLDRIAARELATSAYDFYHGWSGESLRALREARRRNIPGIIEIPTWHRNKGKDKPSRLTKSERERAAARGKQGALNRLLITRQYHLEEYDLATLILVYSERARETFLAAGVAPEKLFYIPLATDIERFTPGQPPASFRAVYVGALIQRKGVHHLLEAWHRLNLQDAELVLVGSVHDEMKPYLEQFMPASQSASSALPRSRRITTGRRASTSSPRPAKAAPKSPTTPPPAASRRSPRANPAMSWSMEIERPRRPPRTIPPRWPQPSSDCIATAIWRRGSGWPAGNAWSKTSPGTISARACSKPTASPFPAAMPDREPNGGDYLPRGWEMWASGGGVKSKMPGESGVGRWFL